MNDPLQLATWDLYGLHERYLLCNLGAIRIGISGAMYLLSQRYSIGGSEWYE